LFVLHLDLCHPDLDQCPILDHREPLREDHALSRFVKYS
jgi:hypothetical protein